MGGDGDLLVRVDPGRSNELLTTEGARPAEMGAGRAMDKGWILVSKEVVGTDKDLAFWLGAALDYNRAKTGVRDRARSQGRSG